MTQVIENTTKWGGLGWHPGLPKFGAAQYIPQMSAVPVSVDLRPFCPPVYDQLQLGSCTANAVGGLAQYLMMKANLPSFVPSRLAIYYWERVIENSVSQDAGASISDSLAVVCGTGCPHESLWWYNINKFAVRPSNKVVIDASKHKVSSALQVNNTNLATMQACLSSGFPITIGFTVYSSFESQQVAQTGVVPMPNSHERVLGGHAVLIVGYDNTRNWFIVRNSWGTQWAAKGYFYMPYAYFTNPNLASDAWTAHSIV